MRRSKVIKNAKTLRRKAFYDNLILDYSLAS